MLNNTGIVHRAGASETDSDATSANSGADLAALQSTVAQLQAMVPDQSHVMMDVAYHFTKLWFAGQAGNWPLTQHFFDETHSHGGPHESSHCARTARAVT